MNKYKPGDKVQYVDGDERIFEVYQVYSNTMVSLCLYGYSDVEQDYLTNINKIKICN